MRLVVCGVLNQPIHIQSTNSFVIPIMKLTIEGSRGKCRSRCQKSGENGCFDEHCRLFSSRLIITTTKHKVQRYLVVGFSNNNKGRGWCEDVRLNWKDRERNVRMPLPCREQEKVACGSPKFREYPQIELYSPVMLRLTRMLRGQSIIWRPSPLVCPDFVGF